jgi:predicted nucleic acid-binding protein
MIVLDTNVLSELMRPLPNQHVISWMDQQPSDQVAITAITVAEILYGIERLPAGKRKAAFHEGAMALFNEDFAGAIIPFDAQAAMVYADVVACRESIGRTISFADAQIAAICINHGISLATRNVKDFEHLDLVLLNPWVD